MKAETIQFCHFVGKIGYLTPKDASKARRGTERVDLIAFKCNACKRWHLGRNKPRPVRDSKWRKTNRVFELSEDYAL